MRIEDAILNLSCIKNIKIIKNAEISKAKIAIDKLTKSEKQKMLISQLREQSKRLHKHMTNKVKTIINIISSRT